MIKESVILYTVVKYKKTRKLKLVIIIVGPEAVRDGVPLNNLEAYDMTRWHN